MVPQADLHANVSNLLDIHSYSYTRGRRDLVAVLHDADGPMTVPDIAKLIPNLSASSAYRNLDVLERCGIIHRIRSTGRSAGRSTGNHAYFELAEPLLGHHHHLICVGCGSIQDIHLDKAFENQIERKLAAAASKAKFSPLQHSLDLHGRCADCATDRATGRTTNRAVGRATGRTANRAAGRTAGGGQS